MEHFELENENNTSVFFIVLMAFSTVFTLGIPWFFAYEMWAEPSYWKNRWKLHRLLNQGKVKVKYNRSTSIYGDRIKIYELDIEGIEYSVWIYDESSMTLESPNFKNNDFIGLFIGCLTTKWLNHIAIKKIIQLSEHTAYEEYEEMSTNCSIKQI